MDVDLVSVRKKRKKGTRSIIYICIYIGPRSWQCRPSAATKGPSMARESSVIKLLLFIIWHSVSDHKMHCLFEFLYQEFADLQDNKTHFIHLRNLGKMFGSFGVKNDSIHLFSLFWSQFEFNGFPPK